MATEVTISPTLGHAVLFTQAGVGTSPGYDFIDIRRAVEGADSFQPGVFDPDGWAVTEGSAATDMDIEVAADVGIARVDGDAVAHQGPYIVAPHSAAITLTVPPADLTNPRVDQVFLVVRDDTHDASGSNDARVVLLEGTPAAGADLDNAAGTSSRAAAPASSFLIAEWVTAANATAITNADIRDRRWHARGLNAAVRSTSTLTTTTGVGVWGALTTPLSITVELSGAPVEVSLHGYEHTAAGGPSGDAGFRLIATSFPTGTGGNNFCGQSGSLGDSSGGRVTLINSKQFPAAGRWTFEVQGTSDGVRARQLLGGTDPIVLRVREMPSESDGL